MGKRKESLSLAEQEKAKVLQAEGRSYHAIAVVLSRSPHTIKKYLNEPGVGEEVQRVKKELADMFEDLARDMIESITPEDVRGINAYQRTVAAGISTDKMRLLKGESTENVNILAVTADLTKIQVERERIKAKLAKIGGLREAKGSKVVAQANG